ncbi:hypothetical protein AB0L82_35540 [Nocardia sp. NPDC052001]|uniref:hypothetical protein n=1 Tax=Nocardia sp. NPDC052001 TaxID=3154853 RepID=UPI00343C4922
MIDNTTHTDDVTPEEMAKLLARVQPGEASVTVPDAGSEDRMQPRSMKLTKDLDLRVGVRAAELGMTKSQYFRWLAEKDLENAYGDKPEMVSLKQARTIATRAVDEALARLSHRPGDAA